MLGFCVSVVLRKNRQPMTHRLNFCRCGLLHFANARCLLWLQPALGLFSLESVFQLFLNHRLMPSKADELVFAAAFSRAV